MYLHFLVIATSLIWISVRYFLIPHTWQSIDLFLLSLIAYELIYLALNTLLAFDLKLSPDNPNPVPQERLKAKSPLSSGELSRFTTILVGFGVIGLSGIFLWLDQRNGSFAFNRILYAVSSALVVTSSLFLFVTLKQQITSRIIVWRIQRLAQSGNSELDSGGKQRKWSLRILIVLTLVSIGFQLVFRSWELVVVGNLIVFPLNFFIILNLLIAKAMTANTLKRIVLTFLGHLAFSYLVLVSAFPELLPWK